MVRIKVLGSLAAEVGGGRVGLGGPRQRGVLAQLLAARGAVVPVDRIIDDLWQGSPPAKAAVSVQAYVSNLRRLLEPRRGPREPARLLVSEPPGYAVRLPPDAVDAWRFEHLLEQARTDRPAAAALALLDEALALWQGDAYAEFADTPWAATETVRLTQLRLAAREQRAALALHDGRPADAAIEARALTDEHPLREEGWRLLALALWSGGRQAEALDVLRRARAVLAEELGLDPGPALAALESAILRQRTDLLTPAAVAPAPAARLPRPPGGPLFVGREAELAALRRAAARARAGEQAVAIVTGEAGAGKSTLLARLHADLTADGWLSARGRCPETEGAPPAWAWTEALRELARWSPPADALTPALAPVLDEGGGHRPPEPRPAPGGGGALLTARRSDALAGRFRLHRAVGDWLRRAAADRPVAIVLDDLHAADHETRALLADLAGGPPTPGLLLVLAHRPGEGDLTDTLAVLARRSPHRVPLAGLGEADAGRLIESVCAAAVDPQTVHALADRTGGNPFYLVESAQLLAGEGALVAVHEVPQGVRDVLRRRFDRLPAAALTALRLAAVAGREADADVLLRASDADEDELVDALESAVAGGLLTEPRPGTVRFTHALVRDTLYADLGGLRRARLHGRVADALRALRPDHIQALAHHYTRAATGATAGLAVDYCVRAAEAAERRYAHETSAALLQQALDNLDRLPPDGADREARRVALLGALLRAQVRMGAVAAATDTRATALRLARDAGRHDLMIEAWTAWTEPTPWVTHPYGTVDQAAVDSLTALLARPGIPAATRCRLLDALSYEFDCSGHPEGWAVAAEALAIARAEGDPRLLAMALAAQARVHDYELATELRSAIAVELSALAGEHDLPAYRWHAELLACTVAATEGDMPALRAHVRTARAIADAYGMAELTDIGTGQQGMLAIAAGRTEEARLLFARTTAGLRARRSPHAEGFNALVTVVMAVQQGRVGEELPLIEQMREVYGPLAADLHALALAALGRPAEARAARAGRHVVPADYYRSLFLCVRAAAVVALDERAEAAALLDELLPLRHLVAGSASTSVALWPVARSLGDLARLLGRDAEAAGYYREAAAVARRWESAHWAADAERALAALSGGTGPEH
ncbi:BTAD domain-containing putative transcriptional regulator [Kitasatospora sp. NPDC057223]|uniref:BTAD domain-containing putative transcriptional regulator n=1 Tax=Kitasatospora sp. NPDC057223 TaxID=3346055 RepID=UPI003634B61C